MINFTQTVAPEERIMAEVATYRFDTPSSGVSARPAWHLALWLSSDVTAASFGFPGETPMPWPGAGLVSLAPAGVPIRWHYGVGETRSLVVRFPPDRLAGLTGLDIDDRAYDFRRLLRIGNARGAALRLTMKQLARELLAPARNGDRMVESLCVQAAIQLGRLLEEVRLPGGGGAAHGGLAPWQMQRLHHHAPALATGQGDLAAVAAECGIGTRHFQRAYKQSSGQALADYLAEVRMDMAVTLLATTTLPIGAIAARLGFAHASGFSIAFRRMAGESPRDYRRRKGVAA